MIASKDLCDLFANTNPTAILELVFNQCFDAVVITKADPQNHQIVYANPVFCKMTGYSLEELLGNKTSILKGPKTNKEVISRLKSNLIEGTPFKGSAINYRKDKTEYYVEWNIHHISDSAGKPKYYISIQRDLTSLKNTLSRLKTTNDQFKDFLLDLTQLSNKEEDLQQRKKDLSQNLVDNAGLFSAPLRDDSRIKYFEKSELFGFDENEKGVMPIEQKKSEISATDYAQKVALTEFEIQNISTIIDDLSTSVQLLSVSKNKSSAISNIIADFQELANTIFFIEEFVDISTVFSQLSIQMQKRENRNSAQVFPEFVVTTFESLADELKNWFNSVFVEKSAGNIHSEDASILASSKQLLEFLKIV